MEGASDAERKLGAVTIVQSWAMVMEKMERLVELRQREVSRMCSLRPLTLNSVNKNLEGAGLGGGDHSSVEYEGPVKHQKRI